MTTNTAGNAAAAGGTRHEAGRRDRRTSVVLQELKRSFGTTRALDGLSLEIAPGEFVALLGPSGCGKTTVLRIVAGFESADAGSVLVDGKDMLPVPPAPPGHGHGVPELQPVPEHVGAGQRGLRAADAEEGRPSAAQPGGRTAGHGRARRPGPAVPAPAVRRPEQRVALARALAIEPSVLLLDEPLSALDAKVRLQLREQIRSLQQRLHTTPCSSRTTRRKPCPWPTAWA